MERLEVRWFCPALWPALLAVMLLSPGCRTPGRPLLFDTAGPGWRVQQGQALWRPGRGLPELGGEIVTAANVDGCCVVQFSKTPLPLVLAQTTRTNWLIQFPPRRMTFAGNRAPPTRFAWLYLHPALSGESLPPDFRFERKPDGGWRLENARSGETLEGFLTP